MLRPILSRFRPLTSSSCSRAGAEKARHSTSWKRQWSMFWSHQHERNLFVGFLLCKSKKTFLISQSFEIDDASSAETEGEQAHDTANLPQHRTVTRRLIWVTQFGCLQEKNAVNSREPAHADAREARNKKAPEILIRNWRLVCGVENRNNRHYMLMRRLEINALSNPTRARLHKEHVSIRLIGQTIEFSFDFHFPSAKHAFLAPIFLLIQASAPEKAETVVFNYPPMLRSLAGSR